MIIEPGFVDYMQAAADFFGPGALEVPWYQNEILDIVRRRGILGQRIKSTPATGQPSRYFEQSRIIEGEYQNPRNLAHNPTGDPTRRERGLMIKAIVGSVNFTMFDVEITRQQGNNQFAGLVAKDLNDAISGTMRRHDVGLWRGGDTSLLIPTSLEYVGGLTQINRTASVASSASIIDALTSEVASMTANESFEVRPTAIYVNPVVADLINQEERANQRQIPTTSVNTVNGALQVLGLATVLGILPIISDWAIPNGPSLGSIVESGKTDYYAVILSEELVEYHYVTSDIPRVFALGLNGDLATRYMVVMFGSPVFKGKANASQLQGTTETNQVTYAHSLVTIVR